MRLAWRVLGNGLDIPRLIRIGPMACTIDGQPVTIDTLRNLVGELFREANQVMSNQLLLGPQTAWINRVITEGNVKDKANEDEVRYSFLSDARNEFHRHGQDLAITFSTIGVPKVFSSKSQTAIDPSYGIKMPW
jgi:hypothetical protein